MTTPTLSERIRDCAAMRSTWLGEILTGFADEAAALEARLGSLEGGVDSVQAGALKAWQENTELRAKLDWCVSHHNEIHNLCTPLDATAIDGARTEHTE